MDQIRNEFSDGSYCDPSAPLKTILALSDSVYCKMMDRDAEPWTVEEGLPPHLLEMKRRYPHMVMDPDTPPWPERVQAIKFLKQNHLPASLLGEYQFPLPPAEVFRPPVMCPPPA